MWSQRIRAENTILGPERLSNADFSNGGTGWITGNNGSLSFPGGGVIRLTNANNLQSTVRQLVSGLTPGRYRLTFRIIGFSGITNAEVALGTDNTSPTNLGTWTFITAFPRFVEVTIPGTTLQVRMRNVGGAVIGNWSEYSNLSIRQVS